MSSYLLTVGIISYNRPFELRRAISSLLPLPEFVEVVICDDKSPKIDEILSNISDLISMDNIRFISNSSNLGYDKNLFNVIELSNSNNVLLLGDDDFLESGALQNVVEFINSTSNFNCGFIRFCDVSLKNIYRNYNENRYFGSDTLKIDGSFAYNSILFSGLIFSKPSVLFFRETLENYFNSIYIQVAIFYFLNLNFGSHFISGPGVLIGGDGESGFGFNEASVGIDSDLKDRSSVISNISYHKRLFNVIKKIESDCNLRVFLPFIKEYKIRSVKAVYEARKFGRKYLLMYLSGLYKLDIPGLFFFAPFYFFIFLSPKLLLDFPIKFAERLISKIRYYKI